MSYEERCEWAFGVETTPREKFLLIAIAARPTSVAVTAASLVYRTGMTIAAVSEAIEDLLRDGWIYPVEDGGFVADIDAAEITELALPASPLADQLQHLLGAE